MDFSSQNVKNKVFGLDVITKCNFNKNVVFKFFWRFFYFDRFLDPIDPSDPKIANTPVTASF